MHSTGHRASMNHILLQVHIVVEIKGIFKREPNLGVKISSAVRCSDKVQLGRTVSKHSHSAEITELGFYFGVL